MDWKPYATRPDDGRNIIVWLAKARFGSHVWPMRTGEVALIGEQFAFDCTPPLYWADMPDGPPELNPSEGTTL